MKLLYENGLLLTSVKVVFQGKTKTIGNVVVDTGAAHSILNIDGVDSLGIYFEPGDKLVSSMGIGGEEYCFSKRIDAIYLDHKVFSDVFIDFGNLSGFDINGLIGLDLLKTGEFIIDLKKLELRTG
ncbi:MAG: aspartyl protease family protein [Bacillales bacterium]|nr:aspartyl protease family protein [Bacillales bacterium]